MEYQFIEFTKNIINNYKNRSYLILNETIESNFTSLWTVINTNIIDFIKDPIIECLINTYHDLKNSNQINGTNRNERINYFFDIIQNKDYVNHFFEEYNVLYDLIELRLENISKLYLSVLSSLLDDKEEIERYYGLEVETISAVSLPQGDIHSGKAVVILTFDKGKLVFKPREMEQEKIIYKAIKFVESKGPERIKYKVPQILSKKGYSWQEFVTSKECENIEQVHRFYYKIGSFLALFYLFNTNDLHFDNMIANAEDPIFFDIETLTLCYAKLKDNVENLKLPFDVTNTIILPLRNTEGLFDVGLSAIYTGDTSSKKMSNLLLKPDEENDWVYESSSLKMNASQNLCRFKGKEVSPWLTEEDVILGFKETYQIIIDNKKWFLNLFDESKNFSVRQLLRPTYIYGKFINASGTPDILKSKEKFEYIFSILSNNFSKGRFGFLRVEAETEELKQWNIPSFYCGFKNTNLYCNEKLICKDYFETEPYKVIENNLNSFSCDRLSQQLRLIHLSFLTLGNKEKERSQNYNELKKLSYSQVNTEETVREYIDVISKYFIQLNNKGYVMQFPYIVKDGFGYQLCKNEFYQYGGIVLLLISYAKYVDNNKKEIARNALNYLVESYLERIDLKNSNIEYSFYYGISSLLYLTYIYSKLFNDQKMFKYSRQIYNDIVEHYLEENDINLDYLSGMPSVIQLLLNIKNDCADIMDNSKSLDDLINKYINSVSSADLSTYDCTLTHGLSGILSSLGIIYSVTYDKKVEDLIKKCVELIQNRYKDINSIYWCKGLTGLLVADDVLRKSSSNKLFIFENREKIYCYIIDNLSQDNQNLCLCHGVNGVILCLDSLMDKNHPLRKKSDNIKENILFDLKDIRWFKHSKAEYDSFMDGSSGLAYAYLSYFVNLPNPLLLEV